MKKRIYDTDESLVVTISGLKEIFEKAGVVQVLYKRLAPNDNSKNQPYLAPHLSELAFLPTGEIGQEASTSKKTSDPKRQIRYKAPLPMSWIDVEGNEYPASRAQVIYYPQYPEVRLSGFLQGCKADLSEWMQPNKQGRVAGRVLFFGVHPEGRVISWLAPPHSRIAQEISETPSVEITSIFYQLLDSSKSQSSRSLLITALRRIHQCGFINGKRLDKHGLLKDYNAPNGGGYTLEAELGVIPNGIAEPDFHGWEVKQFAVKQFGRSASKPQTLMTPQPDGGVYFNEGLESFIKIYGYEDAKKVDRYNFNGRHFYNVRQEKTGLIFTIEGFDAESGKIVDAEGCIALIDDEAKTAASWSFAKLLGHWKKKHNRAVYIPCIKDKVDQGVAYHYGNQVELYSGTTFERFLKAITEHHVYFDPGSRINNISTKPDPKHRSQFRIKHGDLFRLYEGKEEIDVLLPS